MKTVAQRFFDDNWIHAPVLPNKRGGAFAALDGRFSQSLRIYELPG